MCIDMMRRRKSPSALHLHRPSAAHLEVTEMLLSDTLALTAAGVAAIVVMHHHTQRFL
jgi:hypothetical protein